MAEGMLVVASEDAAGAPPPTPSSDAAEARIAIPMTATADSCRQPGSDEAFHRAIPRRRGTVDSTSGNGRARVPSGRCAPASGNRRGPEPFRPGGFARRPASWRLNGRPRSAERGVTLRGHAARRTVGYAPRTTARLSRAQRRWTAASDRRSPAGGVVQQHHRDAIGALGRGRGRRRRSPAIPDGCLRARASVRSLKIRCRRNSGPRSGRTTPWPEEASPNAMQASTRASSCTVFSLALCAGSLFIHARAWNAPTVIAAKAR